MRVPYIMLAAIGAMSLASCETPSFGTQLPGSVTVDDKIGASVEIAYQAAALAERTAVQAGLVNPAQARRLITLDNQAYTYVCYTRTAYDLANGRSPAVRKDTCPLATKSGTIPAYADAARAALTILKEIVGSLQAYQRAAYLEGAPVPATGAPEGEADYIA
jgi:hypothetical protein